MGSGQDGVAKLMLIFHTVTLFLRRVGGEQVGRMAGTARAGLRSMTPLAIFGLFAVTAMLVFYALEARADGSSLPSPEPARSGQSTDFCKAHGHLV